MIGSLISAGTSLLGGLFGRSEAQANRAAQEKYAKNSIQWRVEDAKKAGIHPLAALGAAGASYTPVSSGFGDAVAQAGQSIGAGVAEQHRAKRGNKLDTLNAQLIQSSINNNQAQADLHKAQALNVTAQARNNALGAVGGLNKAPLPMYIRVIDPRDPKKRVRWVLNPEIASDFGENFAPAILAEPDGTPGIMSRTPGNVRKQSRAKIRKLPSNPNQSWLDWMIPSIEYKE